jgi:stage II sporulation protein D
MVRHIIVSVFVTLFSVYHAQDVRVGLFSEQNIKRVTFSNNQGNYLIFIDTLEIDTIRQFEFVDVYLKGSLLLVKKGTFEIGLFKQLKLVQTHFDHSLSIQVQEPYLSARKYEGDFEISAKPSGISLVNVIDMDNYLAGVVESEGGTGRHPEYYKVQAIMSRTYAEKYRNRHKKDGYDLCDRTHCQAYHSMMRHSPLIDTAVIGTRGQLLTDLHNQPLDAYFHANCGGQTCETQYIWNTKTAYLSSFSDTFCLYSKQSTWEKRIMKDDWIHYFTSKFGYPSDDSLQRQALFYFDQPFRKGFFLNPIYGIPLRDIREAFDLRSTFFSCSPDGNEVVLKGKGFGHGVGLCQEGAMKMAKMGYSARQILLYYFPGGKVYHPLERTYFTPYAGKM